MKCFVFALGLAFLTQAGIGMVPQQQNVRSGIKVSIYNFQSFKGVMPINDEYAVIRNQDDSIGVMKLLAKGQLRELINGESQPALHALNDVWSLSHDNVKFQFTSKNISEQLKEIAVTLIEERVFRWNRFSMQLQQLHGRFIPTSCFKEYILDLRNTWTPRNLKYSCTAEKDAKGNVHLMIWDQNANQYRFASLVELLNTLHALEGKLQQNGIVLPSVKGKSVHRRIVNAIEALGLEWKRIRNIAEVKSVTPLNGTYVVADNEVMRYWENQLSSINNDEKPVVNNLLQTIQANANAITNTEEAFQNIVEGYETVFSKDQQQIQIELRQSGLYIPEPLIGAYFNSYMIDLFNEWSSGNDTYTLERSIDGKVYLVVWDRKVGKYRYATIEEQIRVLNELNKKLSQQSKKTVQQLPQSSLIDRISDAAIALGRRWKTV